MSSTTEVTNASMATATTTGFPATFHPEASEEQSSGNLSYILVPIGAVALLFVIGAVVIFLIKKSRLDRLRHHLMPLYNFDPAEEGEDWESELLEGTDNRIGPRTKGTSIVDEPKLAFRGDMRL